MTTFGNAIRTGANGRFHSYSRDHYRSPSMVAAVRTITPDEAKWILEHLFHRQNRKLIRSLIDRLVHAIKTGQFVCTGHGLIFGKDGTLIDGHNRLTAIVEADLPVEILVTLGAPPEAFYAIDIGRTRSLVDIANSTGVGIGKDHAAVASWMNDSYGTRWSTPREALDFITSHMDAINYAVDLGGLAYQRHAPLRAVIARAWYTQDHDRLREFSRAIASGTVDDNKHDLAAIVLRNWLIRELTAGRSAGYKFRAAVYQKTQTALLHFLGRKNITKLYATEEKIYPIPGEE